MVRSELIATYLAALPNGREDEAAEAFAIGQTIGTWRPVPGITDRMRRTHGGRVVDLRAGGEADLVGGEPAAGSWVLRVGFPVANFGPQFPMLFSTLLGNDPSTSIGARLVDLDVPTGYAAAFPGPGLGVEGWRIITGVRNRPLLLNMIKPCTGFAPSVGAEFVREVAGGGPDLVKDDELLASPEFSDVGERAMAYAAVLDTVSQRTGQRPRYIANVTGRGHELAANAGAALDGGADAVMVNILAVGLDAFAALAERRLGVPILAHTAGVETYTGGARSGFGHSVLIGRLARLAGADATLLSSPLAPRPLSTSIFRTTIDAMRDAAWGLRPTAPVVGGGLTAEHVAPLVELAGVDQIIAVGGAIQGHPDGAAAGARAVRSAIDAAVGSGLMTQGATA